jgi:uncharacterized protein DUF4258
VTVAGAVADAQPIAQQIKAERALYEPMSRVIKENWSPDAGLDSVIVEITAQGGSLPTGRWSRPDVTLASDKTYPYVPGRHFELITFEIKPADGLNVTVVYEALAHRRAATRAYILLHVPRDRRPALEDVVEEICLEAKHHGIGVIVAENAGDYETWEELVEAARHEPDPQRMNDFLAKQVSQGFRERMAQRGKTMRDILETMRNGEGVSGPALDKYGDWRIRMRRLVFGRRVQVVVAVRENEFSVVAVI